MSFGRVALALALLTAPVACTGAGRAVPPTAPLPPTITLSIVGTNDLHGGILQRDDRGGLALLGGYVANLRAVRARDGGAVLLIDAGDMFQGTLESNLNEGASVVAAYNALGYRAAAVGNHEFDFGPVGAASTPQGPDDDARGALKARAAEARFPLLAANLIDVATGKPVAWPNVQPSAMVTAAGVQVGIVGVMTEDALSTTVAANTRGLRLAPLADAIRPEAERLRAAGAAVVIVTAHAGGRCQDNADPRDLSSCDLSEEIVRVVRALGPGVVDAIVAGHRHLTMAHQIDGIPIAESYSGGRAFGRIDLILDRTTRRVLERRSFPPRDLCARVDPGTTRCDPDNAATMAARVPAEYEGVPVRPSAAISGVIAPAVKAAIAQKETRLGATLATPIRRGETSESPLGNLFTDAYLAAVPGGEIAINNNLGGIRADLPLGPVTYGGVFEAMPFDNRVVSFRLTGAALRRLVTWWTEVRVPAFPGLAGIRVRVTCRGSAVDVALLRPDGTPVRDDESVRVVTVDFVATGGDRVFEPVMPPGGFQIEEDGGTARDAVVEALRRRGGVLRADDFIDPANPRWSLPGPRPVMCGT